MNELPQTRQSLLLLLRDRSDDAWQEFLEIYEQAIYRYCRMRGLQDADACDVTQEVLAAVDKRVGTWDADPARGKFRGWLFRVARNIAINRIHERSRRAAASGDTNVANLLAELPDSEEAQSTAFWTEYRRALMHWAADQVKPQVNESSWLSFWLTTIEGQKPDQVAEKLNMSVGSVYTAKCRVFARIRKFIENLDDETDPPIEMDRVD